MKARRTTKKQDDKSMKPVAAYCLFANALRKQIHKLTGTTDLVEVSKKTSELWHSASHVSLPKRCQAKAQRQKVAYQKYIKSPEGAVALQAYAAGFAAAQGGRRVERRSLSAGQADVKGKRASHVHGPEVKRAKTAAAGA